MLVFTGTTVGDLPAVPPAALREALVNAVVHANYTQRGAPIRVAVFDGRIELESPGILLPGLTIDELREGVSRVRNRVRVVVVGSAPRDPRRRWYAARNDGR